MRYATVAPNGRILGVFDSDPELVSLRPMPDGAEIIECPNANPTTCYWDGAEFVDRPMSSVTFSVERNTVTLANLPESSIVSVTSASRYQVFEASQTLTLSLQEPGGHVFQIDPWPYRKTTFFTLIEA